MAREQVSQHPRGRGSGHGPANRQPLPRHEWVRYICQLLLIADVFSARIIHPCCHPESGPQPDSEEAMLVNVGKFLDKLISQIRPRKVLFMAIDGVAPRAKMNQQRARRFCSAMWSWSLSSSSSEILFGRPLQPAMFFTPRFALAAYRWTLLVEIPFPEASAPVFLFLFRKKLPSLSLTSPERWAIFS